MKLTFTLRKTIRNRLNVFYVGILNGFARHHFIDALGIGRRNVAREWTAERNDVTHHVWHMQREVARVDTAETPADKADFAAGGVVNTHQKLAQFLAHAVNAADIASESPRMRRETEKIEIAPQNERRDVGREQTGQHQNRMAVAAWRGEQRRRQQKCRIQFEQSSALGQKQSESRRAQPLVIVRSIFYRR